MSGVDSKLLRLAPDFVSEAPVGCPHGHTGSVCLCWVKLYLESTHFNRAFRGGRQIPKRHVLPALGGQSSSVLPALHSPNPRGRPTDRRRMDVPRCAPYNEKIQSFGRRDRVPLELKATINLPKTAFPMKANLPQNEPKMLERWEQMGIYGRIRQARKGSPLYVLHDGPPYANGPIHLGTALNKCLKDFVVKSKTMAGFDAPYVPGWDCHGLPIEIKVDKELGGKKLQMKATDVRLACRKYAEGFLDLQRGQFKRIGVFGRWDRPYSTMTPQYESVVLETFFSFYEKEFVYKGLRAVYWCMHDETALAEAEVEYENHTSPTVWVKYALLDDPAKIDPGLAGKKVSTIIWTTTPWTLPASMAVAFHPDEEYVALESAGEVYIVAARLAADVAEKCGLESGLANQRNLVRFPGRKLEHL